VSAEEIAKLAPAKRGFTLVFVGRVVREKALETLVRAVSLAKARVPGLALWIVGGGAARGELEALAAELGVSGDVTFWGQQTQTAPFFSAADAFVMSSISEGLPMSLLQSMSLGTPAILTDVDGMGEVLRLTQSGLLVPVGDAAAFAEAIVRLAGDEALRAELSRRALEAYRTRFTVETMAAGYMELYRGRVGVRAGLA
jgi:glycosyltransferase involved in cell wall biosynthesis